MIHIKNVFLALSLFLFSLVVSAQSDELQEEIRRQVEYFSANGSNELICRKALPVFYQERNFTRVWNQSEVDAFVGKIKTIDKDGLNPADYHLAFLNELKLEDCSTLVSKADAELLLTDAWLLLASHLVNGKVNPMDIDPQWEVVKVEVDAVAAMNEAVSNVNLTEALDALVPDYPGYRKLKEALARYRRYADTQLPQIEVEASIKPGDSHPEIAKIRQRLLLTADIKPYAFDDSLLYDETLALGVTRFQDRHGLDADGAIGKQTAAAMNISVADRIAQLKANLERWKWLPRDLGEYYFKVNIAAFELEVVRDGKIIRTHRVMVGKPFRQTPVFSATMQYLVFNPTWTVPSGIMRNDVLPGVRKDPEYFAKKNMVVFDNAGGRVDPAAVDWNKAGAGGYTVRQTQGKTNALGAVKFIFPNPHSVYLHDTPSKELFNKAERAFSSGCIRVEKPLELAEYLLNDSAVWNRKNIDKLVATNRTQTVELKEKPIVYLLYSTAYTDMEGVIHFRKDIYDRDQALINALETGRQ